MRPDIEQLNRTLMKEKAAYIPLAELGIHPVIKQKFLHRSIVTLQDEIAFWHQAGYDYIKLQPGADFHPTASGLDGKATFNDDGTISRKWATAGKGVITNFDEFERFAFPEKSTIDYSRFERIGPLLPEGMGVIGQYGDIFTLVWELMGFEEFSLALFMNPALIRAMFDKIGGLIFSMFEYFAQNDRVDILWYSDDIAFAGGLLISPDALRQYFFPWLNKIGELAKTYDKPFIYHTDGVLFEVFDDIIACGVNAIHPIEPKAMDIVEVKERIGDRLALIGNIDVDLLARGTQDEVRRQVIKNIEDVGQDGGYCVGSGNSVPEYVKFENYLAMIRTVKEISSG
ncbi:MAG: uroporphyrinogen decarboxylase family protein [bacterium]